MHTARALQMSLLGPNEGESMDSYARRLGEEELLRTMENDIESEQEVGESRTAIRQSTGATRSKTAANARTSPVRRKRSNSRSSRARVIGMYGREVEEVSPGITRSGRSK